MLLLALACRPPPSPLPAAHIPAELAQTLPLRGEDYPAVSRLDVDIQGVVVEVGVPSPDRLSQAMLGLGDHAGATWLQLGPPTHTCGEGRVEAVDVQVAAQVWVPVFAFSRAPAADFGAQVERFHQRTLAHEARHIEVALYSVQEWAPGILGTPCADWEDELQALAARIQARQEAFDACEPEPQPLVALPPLCSLDHILAVTE